MDQFVNTDLLGRETHVGDWIATAQHGKPSRAELRIGKIVSIHDVTAWVEWFVVSPQGRNVKGTVTQFKLGTQRYMVLPDGDPRVQ